MTKRIAPPNLGIGGNLGVKRITDLPLELKDLPPIDLVLISHAHYDHFDKWTLKNFHDPTFFIIPRNTSDRLPKADNLKFKELNWNQSLEFKGIKISSYEAYHWGGIKPTKREERRDRGHNLYVLEFKGKKLLFGGDSGFKNKHSVEIDWSKRLGKGFDICILPIGDYEDYYNPEYHMSPEEAWAVFNQLEGKHMIPIHWRTMLLTRPKHIPVLEPGKLLFKAAAKDSSKIVIREPGHTFVMK